MAEERNQPEYLIIGRVAGPFGIRGEIKMEVLGSFPDRYSKLKRVFLGGGSDGSQGRREYKVLGGRSRTVKDQLLFKFEGVTTPEQVDAMRGLLLQIPVADAPPLAEGEYYVFQLVGLDVRLEDGSSIGKIKDVMQMGANDVYVVTPSDPDAKLKEYLIPVVDEMVKEVKPDEGYVVVTPIEGLLELVWRVACGMGRVGMDAPLFIGGIDMDLRSEVLTRTKALLAEGKVMSAKDIAAALLKGGLAGVDKSLVNSVLAKEGRGQFSYDRTSYTYTLADPNAPPLAASPHREQPASDEPTGPAADRTAVLNAARALLADGTPRMAKEIAAALTAQGIAGVDKSLVNSVLAKEGKGLFNYDRATFKYSTAT